MSPAKSYKTPRKEPVPAFYLPAMWPLGLQHRIADTWAAWRWRRGLRRLLQDEERGLARLGADRAAVERGAQEDLAVIAARIAERRRRS
ncbi:hypothetical protein [Pseudomonas sp. GD03944]|uniref:hypothetical protein n=1 Tax=Pseudomonas sp. GD03944 TaxID=2975409 RepID=UPI0024474ECD|nr:hypothetical protein [Pseudomonas sp. GD03944]MDH1261916.1 hypothetical protein [Pseudomonas sp. GD03944]